MFFLLAISFSTHLSETSGYIKVVTFAVTFPHYSYYEWFHMKLQRLYFRPRLHKAVSIKTKIGVSNGEA